MVCKCKPSLFAYPKPVTAESNKVAVKMPTAVLSTTARAKKREADKKAAEKADGAGPSGGSGQQLICLQGFVLQCLTPILSERGALLHLWSAICHHLSSHPMGLQKLLQACQALL